MEPILLLAIRPPKLMLRVLAILSFLATASSCKEDYPWVKAWVVSEYKGKVIDKFWRKDWQYKVDTGKEILLEVPGCNNDIVVGDSIFKNKNEYWFYIKRGGTLIKQKSNIKDDQAYVIFRDLGIRVDTVFCNQRWINSD